VNFTTLISPFLQPLYKGVQFIFASKKSSSDCNSLSTGKVYYGVIITRIYCLYHAGALSTLKTRQMKSLGD